MAVEGRGGATSSADARWPSMGARANPGGRWRRWPIRPWASDHQEIKMSLDDTSHPSIKHSADKLTTKYIHGRPGPELVPSRYALRIGAIDVLVVSDGVLPIPAAIMAHN